MAETETFDANTQNAFAKRFSFYLEGYKARFITAVVSATKGAQSQMTVTMPFDHKGKIRALAAKTIGEMYFIGLDDKLYFMFRGELTAKSYSLSRGGIPQVSVQFLSISSNYDAMRIGTPTNLDSNAAASMELSMANESGIMILAGTSPAKPGSRVYGSFTNSQATEHLIAGTIRTAFGGDVIGPPAPPVKPPDYSLPNAYAQVVGKFLSPKDSTGVIAKASNVGIFASIAHFRFNLIDSIVGASSNQLVQTFADPTNTTAFNEFIDAAVGMYATGENSVKDLMDVIVNQFWHVSVEPICPGMVKRKKVSADIKSAGGEGIVGPPLLIPDDANGDGTDVGVIPLVMIFPTMLNANPPVCNVFMGPVVKSANFSATIAKPTRMFVSQVTQLHDAGTARIVDILPADLKNRMIVREGDNARLAFPNGITTEEVSIGVHALNIANPMPNPNRMDEGFMQNFVGATSQLRFIEQRSGLQSGSIEMSFNPYPVHGLPGLYYHPSMGVIRGSVHSIQHTLTPNSGTTSVLMSNCELSDEAIDNIQGTGLNLITGEQEDRSYKSPRHVKPIPSIDDGLPFSFNGEVKRLDYISSSQVSDVYYPTIGVRSVTDWFRENKGSTPKAPKDSKDPKKSQGNLNYTGKVHYVQGVIEELYKYLMSDEHHAHYFYRRMVSRPLIDYVQMKAYHQRDSVGGTLITKPEAGQDYEILDFPGLYVGTGVIRGEDENKKPTEQVVSDFKIRIETPQSSSETQASGETTQGVSADTSKAKSDEEIQAANDFAALELASTDSIRMPDRASAVFEYLKALEVSKDFGNIEPQAPQEKK